jgi:hypothetical protein
MPDWIYRILKPSLNAGLGDGPYNLNSFYTNSWAPLPDEAQSLSLLSPRLLELSRTYREFGDPPCNDWGSSERNLPFFRADNDYVWQPRYFVDHFEKRLRRYAEYVASVDRLGLMKRCIEDLQFGAFGVFYGDQIVSRDLLDSVLQINLAYESVDALQITAPTVLDIGAGYGRLAHRISESFGGSWKTLCADGIALSTFLSEWYLDFRQVRNCRVVPVNDLRKVLKDDRPQVAFNVHSFSEIPCKTVVWWLNELEIASIDRLVVVTNERSMEFLSSEVNGDRIDLFPILNSRGWTVERQEPLVANAKMRQASNVHNFFLYLRRS